MRERRLTITERLVEMHEHLREIAKNQERDHKLLREIKKTMATQADVDAVTAKLDGLKTAVTKIGADFTAFANRPGITLEALQAKATEVGTKLQEVDDLIPEQEPAAS